MAVVPVTISDLDLGDPAAHGGLYELLHDLRPRLTRAGSDRFLEEGHRQGLLCVVAHDGDGEFAGLALYRVLATSRGRIVFLEDLVTRLGLRSRGVGAAVLKEVEVCGRRAGCERIEFDSGTSNGAAHRFYERHGMAIIASHFGKELG